MVRKHSSSPLFIMFLFFPFLKP